MMSIRSCPAVLIAAPASGQGKTTFTAALARYHRQQGRRVRVFKVGPDFLDPMIHACASGMLVENLDLWMVGPEQCRALLYDAAGEADLILIEGVMGLFDGTPSSADVAQLLGVPVLALLDASAVAQTFAALAWGLAKYRPELPFAGVIANRVASAYHAALLQEGLPADIPFLGWLAREASIRLPDRHLGLVQASEISDLEQRLEQAARLIGDSGLGVLPAAVEFAPQTLEQPKPLLRGIRIGVARDQAFSFIYAANLRCLQQMGAELRFFSPLSDTQLPNVDALYLPGGYPELHLSALAANQSLLQDIRAHHQAQRPIFAECGGMLYLLQRLTHHSGATAELAGVLPGSAELQTGLVGLGMQSLVWGKGELRGHTFHHSRSQIALLPHCHARRQRNGAVGEAFYVLNQTRASYLHLYFPSHPAAAAQLFLAG